MGQRHWDHILTFNICGAGREQGFATGEQGIGNDLPQRNAKITKVCYLFLINTHFAHFHKPIVGSVRRAPPGWQKLGLEWFYRLLRQPARAGRKLQLLVFAWQVFLLKLGIKKA